MEFDARTADPDKVSFECKLTLTDGEVVQLQFRDYALIPSRVSLFNIGDEEAQLWQSMRWGLISPKHWPTDDENASPLQVFKEVPASITMKIHSAWQKAAGVTAGESPASTTSSESTEQS